MADTTLPHNISDPQWTGDGFWSSSERGALSSKQSSGDLGLALGSDAIGPVSKKFDNGSGSQSGLVPSDTTGPILDLGRGDVGDGVDPRRTRTRGAKDPDSEASHSASASNLSRFESSTAGLKNRILAIVIIAAGVSAVILAFAASTVVGNARRNKAAALRHHFDDLQHLNKIDHNRLFGAPSQNLLVAE